MRRAATATAATVLAATLTAALAGPAGAAPVSDVAGLAARLDAVTAHATLLAAALEQAGLADGGLRHDADALDQAHTEAAAVLARRVREVYISSLPAALSGWRGLSGGGPAATELARRGRAGALGVDQQLVADVTRRAGAAREAVARATAYRERLRAQAQAVLAEQDTARELLGEARRLAAEQAAREQAAREQAAREQAARQQVAREQATAWAAAQAQVQAQATQAARLAGSAAALDAVSATVTAAFAPPVTERGRRAVREEEPVLSLLERTGPGYPQGWTPTGQVVRGTASWYGPGFVGSPTATGRPYDPERLTCAHLTLPFGTVLHLTARGGSTNCLVDDRGPYVAGRVLDLSRAADRALGSPGLGEVTAEVLAPVR